MCLYELEFGFFTLVFRKLLKDDPVFYVPEVIQELSSKEVLTSELVAGVTLDKLENVDQETRNMVSDLAAFTRV